MDEQTNQHQSNLQSLIEELQRKLNTRSNIDEISAHYRLQIQELIKDASQSTDWLIVTKYLADLIFQGTVQDFLLNITVNRAMNPLIDKHNAQEVELIEANKKVNKAKADRSKGGKARAENDPKSLIRNEIEREFQKRKTQFCRYGYKAEFVREMYEKQSVVTSIKTIEKWVTELKKKYDSLPS